MLKVRSLVHSILVKVTLKQLELINEAFLAQFTFKLFLIDLIITIHLIILKCRLSVFIVFVAQTKSGMVFLLSIFPVLLVVLVVNVFH